MRLLHSFSKGLLLTWRMEIGKSSRKGTLIGVWSTSILSGGLRCRKGLRGVFFLGGRWMAPLRSRSSKSPRQIMSLGWPFGWVQFHARQSLFDRAQRPSSGCSAITCLTRPTSADEKALFLKVNAFSMHDGIAHSGFERKRKDYRNSTPVNDYPIATSTSIGTLVR